MFLQSIWVSGRGVQRELDEAKLRFAAAEVFDFNLKFSSVILGIHTGLMYPVGLITLSWIIFGSK